VAWRGVDGGEVVLVVGSSLGEGDDVVDLVGPGHVADVTDPACASHDPAVAFLLG
jgi:hypothetical protein